MTRLPKPIPYHLMEQIRQGIIVGRYVPGSPLREQTLEQEFGASRGPIREALRLLELRGLATHEPRRGFRVREYNAEMVTQMYKLRGLLERHSVEALADKPLDGLIVALQDANERMAVFFKANNIEAYLAANIAFHDLILQHAGNEPLHRAIEILNEMAQPVRYALLSRKLTANQAVRDHAQIIELLSAGDLGAASMAMEQHVVKNLAAVHKLFV